MSSSTQPDDDTNGALGLGAPEFIKYIRENAFQKMEEYIKSRPEDEEEGLVVLQQYKRLGQYNQTLSSQNNEYIQIQENTTKMLNVLVFILLSVVMIICFVCIYKTKSKPQVV